VPLVIYNNRKIITFALSFFIILYLLGLFIAQKDPNFIRAILSDGYVNMTRDNIEMGKPFGVYGNQDAFTMFVSIAWNNIQVALLCFGSFVYLLYMVVAHYASVAMGEARPQMWVNSIVLLLPIVYGVVWVISKYKFYTHPDRMKLLINTETTTSNNLNTTITNEQYIRKQEFKQIWKNIRATYLFFVLGVLCIAGSLFILFRNGVMVGTFHQMFIEHGFGIKWIFVVMIHGTLELFSIAVAGASGIMLGNALLFPKTHRRIVALRKAAVDALKIISIVVLMLFVAAIFESYVTRYENMPLLLSATILLACVFFIVIYFYFLPKKVSKEKQIEMQNIKDTFLKMYP
jgi:uncharacterized membrane protein SpoIIM required for sporulation